MSKDGGDVDAITASTITTRAFLNAVNNAYAAYSGQNVDGISGATEQASSTDTKTTDCGNEPNSAACGTCNLHKNN